MFWCSYRYRSSGLAYYTDLDVNERPGGMAIWHVAAIDFIAMALVRSLHAAE